ncbi:hypothetical protein [Bacillus thuringiensis]
MFDTVQLDMENWKYVLETDFFKNDEECATFFRWITKLSEFNFIADKEDHIVATGGVSELGKMDLNTTTEFIERLKEHVFLLEIIMPYYLVNPNLAVQRDVCTNWLYMFQTDFTDLEKEGVLKGLPNSYWEYTYEDKEDES